MYSTACNLLQCKAHQPHVSQLPTRGRSIEPGPATPSGPQLVVLDYQELVDPSVAPIFSWGRCVGEHPEDRQILGIEPGGSRFHGWIRGNRQQPPSRPKLAGSRAQSSGSALCSAAHRRRRSSQRHQVLVGERRVDQRHRRWPQASQSQAGREPILVREAGWPTGAGRCSNAYAAVRAAARRVRCWRTVWARASLCSEKTGPC